jgi:4a-hydroxytetrahydrobiopterin dehydratase
VVERLVANEKVVGSSPIARSIYFIMEDDLSKKKCVPCEGGIPPFNYDEIHKYLKKVDGWDVKKNDQDNYFLTKEFKFKDFKNSQNFINKVSDISENENHHPDINFGWGYAKITIFTHAINGLAESDFILASKIDKIIND